MKVAIILGNRMNDDGSMSDTCIRRCLLAKEIIDKGLAQKVILSGGIANKKAGKSEAGAMYQYLIEQGVDENVLLKEEKSTTTVENAEFSIPMAIKENPDGIIVCTTLTHLTRKYFNPIRLFEKQLQKYPNVKLYAYSGQ